MRIQALKNLLDGNVMTKKGTVYEEDDYRAKELIALGNAVHIPEPKDSQAAPIAFLSNEDASDPFTDRRTGGRVGSAKPASSLPEDQARPKRTYRKRTAKSES